VGIIKLVWGAQFGEMHRAAYLSVLPAKGTAPASWGTDLQVTPLPMHTIIQPVLRPSLRSGQGPQPADPRLTA
jgi:hypothetical protein